MNYPLRNGILHYITEHNAEFLADTLKEIYALYPKSVCDSLMNLLGTHDTERILTVLGEGDERREGESNDTLARKRLSPEQRARGIARLKIAAAIQYTVYGVPSVFYGDEAGLEGYHDPFCRRPYPWHAQDEELLAFYRTLGQIRRTHGVFADGVFSVECAEGALLAFSRRNENEKITVLANVGETPIEYRLGKGYADLLTGLSYDGILGAQSVRILTKGAR